jgi:hypothetical protein
MCDAPERRSYCNYDILVQVLNEKIAEVDCMMR